MRKIFALFLISTLLTACGDSRDNKDKKLAYGCQAGIKALLNKSEYDRQIDTITKQTVKDEATGRRVILQTKTKNKSYGYVQDEAFSCVFDEGSVIGPFGYKAELIQATIDEKTYGRKDGQILGDMNDFMLLSNAVEGAIK